MKSFVFVSCFIALAIARPEAGYSYNAPAPPPAPTYSQSAPTSYQQPPSGSSYSDSGVVGASYSVGGQQSYSSEQNYASAVGGFADTSANYNSGSYSSGSALGSGSGFAGAQTVIQKHIYVHVPPPDTEQSNQGGPGGPGGVNQKHYKIIFIKAPSSPSYSAAQIAAQQAANQEKTIVYVLVKKPEDNVDASGNSIHSPPIVPSKPEVYFIKYKTQGAATSGGQISSSSGIIGGSHDAISGVSYDHSSSHAHGQPAAAYGPPN